MGQGSTTAPAAEGFRIYPPLLAALCLAGTLALHLMMGGGHDVLARHVIGLIITAGGTGLSFFAAAIFQARETTKNPYGEPSSFVVMMPYTFTRNPMYLGLSTVRARDLLRLGGDAASAGHLRGRDRPDGDSARRGNHGAAVWRAISRLQDARQALDLKTTLNGQRAA
jgi:hypothetical protein